MSLIGSVPGQKKKKKKDLKIGERLKKLFKGKTGSKMSLLGDLPGQEKNTPYKELAKKNGNNSVKKKTKTKTKTYTKAQLLAKKRIGSGTAKNPDKTIAQVNAENKKKVKDAARKRNAEFKKTGKSTIEQRRAEAKKRMQEAARKRHEAFKAKRKLKAKNKNK